ncbi:peptidyl-prolyl cis-trans isomerase [Cystobacter fuscus]|uniref:peptidylprolyl isomerase n=1 Tax=Cystobacter fuscus TaxID=43 RepID=UPI002B2DB264|nr:peptidylprolyl isomerase [Cystobacter fuscus]
MNPSKISVAATTAALLLLHGCKAERGDTSSAAPGEPVVARVGDGTITASEFKAKLEEQPAFIRSRYTSLESKKEFLDNLIRFELLAQEARNQGLDQDPEVKATLEKLMVQKLIQKQAAAAANQKVTEEELKKYYQDHLSEFVRPERVRVSQVFLASASEDPKRGQVKAEADKLLADVRRREVGPDKTAFGALARSRSDDATTREADGDLGFKTREELSAQWGPQVAEAAFGLKAVGELSEVASARGLHLLKLVARQPGLEQTLDMVRARIESRLLMEKRAHAVDDFTASIKSKTQIQIDDQALNAVTVQVDGVGSAQTGP